MTDSIIPGIYEHFQGGKYRVWGTSTHTETGEKTVIYESIEGSNDSTRFQSGPLETFLEKVEVDGKFVPRFKRKSYLNS